MHLHDSKIQSFYRRKNHPNERQCFGDLKSVLGIYFANVLGMSDPIVVDLILFSCVAPKMAPLFHGKALKRNPEIRF